MSEEEIIKHLVITIEVLNPKEVFESELKSKLGLAYYLVGQWGTTLNITRYAQISYVFVKQWFKGVPEIERKELIKRMQIILRNVSQMKQVVLKTLLKKKIEKSLKEKGVKFVINVERVLRSTSKESVDKLNGSQHFAPVTPSNHSNGTPSKSTLTSLFRRRTTTNSSEEHNTQK
ncbi:hypothetical protein RFI_09067 [Reticulomyxa filosa]|uniref:Uncharacterized protein n=1 Tax=Reticulomyxa filosa TaxID=46433 RepID=X6NPW9_RETFI|nr:hypothetical protein RFI_09067 [Reticulomyxa filosa]|eukprot:ETO28066.1 hypothetical protein RFI_09067 [Reticulomyxa filosa]